MTLKADRTAERSVVAALSLWVGLALTLGACEPEPHTARRALGHGDDGSVHRTTPDTAQTVVLLHGLGRTPASMEILQSRLEAVGYRTVDFGYPSRTGTIESLTVRLDSAFQACCGSPPAGRVHFVTHSMGGVLVRRLLSRRERPFEGRVVMLSPPSQGSEIVDAFRDSPLIRRWLGPAGSRLGTDSAAIARELGPIDFCLGVITGNQSLDPLGSFLIPGDDDGKVAVDRAAVDGAAFLVMPVTHTFIMTDSDVAREVLHFLAEGRFSGGSKGSGTRAPTPARARSGLGCA